MSKNNAKMVQQKMADQKQRFGIRKLSIGVASVLLGTLFYMQSGTVYADVNPTASAGNDGINVVNENSSTSSSAVGSSTINRAGSTSSSSSVSSAGDATNSIDTHQVSASPVESATGQANNNAAIADREQGSSVPTSHVNAGDDKTVKNENSNLDYHPTQVPNSHVALEKSVAGSGSVDSRGDAPFQPVLAMKAETETPVAKPAVDSEAPKRETVDSTWTLHYVNQADHKQELKDPTVITMQYARTNTPQSDGTTQYGDWSYVPGSFKQTGTPITVNDSDNPVKQDNVDKNGENFDVFTITAMYPTVAGYSFYNGINGTRLHDNVRNNERQADSMSKDFYAEYDVAKSTQETVDSKWIIHYVDSTNREHELKAPTVINMQYVRTNTPQSDGTIQHGDWSYVSGSFKQTGTPITVNDSDNPIKQDNVDNNGKNEDVFTITAMYPIITGYNFHDGINNMRLHDHLLNYDPNGTVQAPTMGQDFDVEYDPIGERSVTVKFVDDQYFKQQVGQAVTVTGRDGDTVDLKLTVPDKYKLADGQQLPTTYTFTKGSGDLKIHLVHKVVQREATIDVKLGLITLVRTRGDDGEDAIQQTVTQTRWKQLGDDAEHLNGFLGALPVVGVGTLTGHVNYDLVDEAVASLKDDWTSLNLSGHSYQLPNGTEVVNGIRVDADDTMGKKLRDDWYLNEYRKWHHDVDPDYITRPWYGYLSVNETNNERNSDYGIMSDVRESGFQAGLAGDEPNALAKAIGDRAATSVEMANKPIDLNFVQQYDLEFNEQDGQLRAKALLPVAGVYIPYVEKTATRTINVTTPDGKTTAIKQTATLAKQVDFGKDAHPAWTTGEWTSYDVPTIPGYTASQSNVAKEAVTGTTEDQTVNITYTANPQTTTVVYQTEDGTPVHTTTVKGQTGQTVKVPSEVPVGWTIVKGEVPSEITFTPNGTPQTVVTIAHQHVTVDPDHPQNNGTKLPDNPDKTYPTGVSENDLSKTITRTIKVTTPDGQTKTVEQTAKLTRTADVDEVTGEVKYSDWTTGEWDKYDVPTVPGYTASQSSVTQQEVTDATKDQTVNITYTANDHQISIEYVDNATGHVVKTDHMSGKTGQTVSITPHIPDGWELLSGQSVPSEVTLGADGAPATVIKVQPQERSVAVKFVDDQSFDPDTSDLKKQVGQAVTVTGRDGDTVNLKLTVPDKYRLADGQQLPTTYTFTKGSGDLTIHLAHQVAQREATVNVQLGLVTVVDIDDYPALAVTQTRWKQLDDKIKDSKDFNSDKVFPSVKVGTLTGHVGYDLVDNQVVSFNDDWTSLNLGGQTYQMPDGTEVVNGMLIDSASSWGKTLKEQYLKYSPDTDPDYVNQAWHGYLSVNKTNEIASDFTSNDLQAGLVGNEPNKLAKAIGDQAATAVKIANKTIDSNWLKGNFDTSEFSEQNGRLQGSAKFDVMGFYIPYVEKTATRTINVTTPDGKTTAVKQTATLAKQVTEQEDAHPDWTTGEWASYDVPTIPGYTASQSNVAKETVTGTTEDQTVNITYTANPQTTTVIYQSEDGTPVHTTTVNGHTGQTVKVPSEVPAGWMITKGEVPSEITFGADGHESVVITVDHHHITITSDQPQDNGTKLPDNPAKTFSGVETNDLNKIITRTIKVTTPDGKTTTTKQTVKLTRTADVDEVTGEVTYGNWTTGEWAAYNAPSVAGYTPSQTAVAKESVTATSNDTTVEITYQPMQHQISVEYVDDDDHGKVVKTDQMPGKTDQTITVTPSAPANYDLVDNGNRTYTVTSDDAQAVQIHVKHHQVTTSESKTVTRTINVHTPHAGTKVIKQAAELTRNVTTDQVTGEKTYGDWTTGQWESYTPETISGYTPSINDVPNTHVDGSSKNQTVDVTYTADAQKVEIVYVDDAKGGAVVKTDQVAGKTDETVKVTPDVPAGYSVVSEVPGSYTMTADDHQVITVHLVHQMKTTGEDKTATRTINVHTPHDGTTVFKQTAKLSRDVTTDQVTGDKTYGDWSTTEWTHYDVPVVAGYTPSIKQVAQQVVDGTTTDQTVNVTYTANAQTTHVNYVDGDGNVVHTTTITGKTDQTVKVPNETPAGWKIVGESVQTEITFGPDGYADVTVAVDHQHVTVTSDDPKTPADKLPNNPGKTYPDGVGHDDLNRTVTRTIKVTTPDRQTKTVAQKVQLTRTADIDEVTGKVTYGKWTTGEWSRYEVPSVPGYTASQSEVPAVNVTDTTKDQMLTLTYTANDQTTHVNYVDGDGKTVHVTTITGKTDQTVKVLNEVPTGWTITDGQVPAEITFGPDGHADVAVTVDHQHVTVTPDKPKIPSDKLPNNPGKTYPAGVGHDDLNKTITRTIKVTTPDGKTQTTVQKVQLTRTADVDEVTGEVTYGKWTTGEWANYTVPAVPGYTASQSDVPATKVTSDTKNQTVTVTYTANAQTTTINYVDGNGKTVHTTTVTGHTDQTVKVPNETPAGWTIADGQVPTEITFGPNGHDNVIVTVGHKHVTVTPDKPQTDGTKLPDNPSQTFHGVGHDDLNKTIVRTIEVTVPTGKTKTVKQTVKLTRSADVDEVTGEVTYGKWTTSTWSSYNVPTVTGYTPSQAVVDEVAVNADMANQTVKITYTANDQTTHINYVDGDGEVVHTTTIKGHTDQTVKVPNETPAGWTIIAGQVPSEVTFGADGHADVKITVDHRHTTVTSDDPKTDGTKLPDNSSLTFQGVEHDDLNRTVTRKIKVTTPDGKTQTVAQKVQSTRSADVDEATGEVTYGDWSTGAWSSYTAPTVPGYTASQVTVPATKVTAETADQTVAITYTANDQTTHINYVDGNGKIVRTTTITGKTDQTVKVLNEVPTGWTITDGQVPSEVIFGANGYDDVTVTVDHQHVTVTPDKAKTNGTQLPDNSSKTFHGVAETDLNKVVTRTIEVVSPAQKTTTVKQTAKLTRTADVDEVTGEVTYGKWTTGTWSSYTVPTVAGYNPSQAVVTEVAVDANTSDQTVKITYTADSHTTHINYVDKDGNVVHATTVAGTTDQTVKVPNEVPTGWKVTGESVPIEITFGPDGHADVTVTVDHLHVTVTPDQPRENDTKLPNTISKSTQSTQTASQNISIRTSQTSTPQTTNDVHASRLPQTGNKHHESQLPQTGNKSDSKLELIGLIGIAFAGLFGFGTRRKKRD